MLKRPDEEVLEALSVLESDTDFARVRAWVAASLKDLSESLERQRDEVQARWTQGAAQALREFSEMCGAARETLRRRRETR